MTFYGVLLALLPHGRRLRLSPSYIWGTLTIDDPVARRRFARRVHGSVFRLALGAILGL